MGCQGDGQADSKGTCLLLPVAANVPSLPQPVLERVPRAGGGGGPGAGTGAGAGAGPVVQAGVASG